MKSDMETVVNVLASECSICLTPFQSLEEEISTLSCGCQFCHQCVKAYVQEKISNGIIEISCLNIFCDGVMEKEEVKTFCEDDMHRRIITMRRNLEVARDETRMWCLTRDCDGICEIPPSIIGEDRIVKCDQCNREHNLSRPDKEDVLISIMGINENIISCPKCKILIEKNGGCNLVRCKNCYTEFDGKHGVVVWWYIYYLFFVFLQVIFMCIFGPVLALEVSPWYFMWLVPFLLFLYQIVNEIMAFYN